MRFFKFPHLHEWIGRRVKVIASTSSFKGIEGILIYETKNTIVIKTHRSKKIVPKEGNTVAFFHKGVWVPLCLSKLRWKPEERLKRAKISKHVYLCRWEDE